MVEIKIKMPYENVIDSSRMKLWLEHISNKNEVDEGNTLDLSEEQMPDDYCNDNEYLKEKPTRKW